MARVASLGLLDDQLDTIVTFVRIALLTAEPANFAAIGTSTIGEVTVTGVDFTLATSGSDRTCTVAAQAGVSVTTPGTGTHVAIHDNAAEYVVTTCDSIVLSTGTFDIPEFVLTAKQPVAP